MDMKLEVVRIPVSDADEAKEFYKKLGFREDADIDGGNFRLIQFTPPGSSAAIFVGEGITKAKPGSMDGLVLVVDDIEAAYNELIEKGIEAEEIFHGDGGLQYYVDKAVREPGIDPNRTSYRSFTAFSDPDGNGWIVQEITGRFPGRA